MTIDDLKLACQMAIEIVFTIISPDFLVVILSIAVALGITSEIIRRFVSPTERPVRTTRAKYYQPSPPVTKFEPCYKYPAAWYTQYFFIAGRNDE